MSAQKLSNMCSDVPAARSVLTGHSILILSRHSEKAASSRLRTHQFIPYLESAGATVTVAPFFDERYLNHLYDSNGKRKLWDILKAYWKRASRLFKVRNFSVVWVEKELFPYLPAPFEAVLLFCGVRWVVDFDDAIFHTYDQHRSWIIRALLTNKLLPLLRGAQIVIVGNEYLEEKIRILGAQNTLKIPTVVDTDRYSVGLETYKSGVKEFRIGWIGTPETSKYLEGIIKPLLAVSKHISIRLITIGARRMPGSEIPIEQHEWSLEAETKLISTFDVGIMPLPDAPWERGKCGYKLIQYMAAGKPVIASPVGENKRIVVPKVGFLARNDQEWQDAITSLAIDRPMREEFGAYARRYVKRNYSLASAAPQIIQLFENIVTQRTTSISEKS